MLFPNIYVNTPLQKFLNFPVWCMDCHPDSVYSIHVVASEGLDRGAERWGQVGQLGSDPEIWTDSKILGNHPSMLEMAVKCKNYILKDPELFTFPVPNRAKV